MTGAQVIVLAMPVFLLAIALEFAIGRGPRPQHLPAERHAGQPGPGRDEPGVRRLRHAVQGGDVHAGCSSTWRCSSCRPRRRGCGSARCSATTSATTGCTAPATAWACCGPRTWCTTRARTTTWAPRCARPAAASCFGWIFYLPLAVAGVPPLVFGVVALIDLLYQFWVHTQQVGKLGWFDRWFCSPSNHRAHHARERALPGQELRRHPDPVGPPVRHLRRGRR